MGKQINSLGLSTAKCKKSPVKEDNEEYDQKAIIFDPVALEKLLKNYSLPLPADLNVPSVPKAANDSNQSSCIRDIETESTPNTESKVPDSNAYKSDDYELRDIGDIEIKQNIEVGAEGIETESFETVASVDFMITKDIRQQLYDLGYSRTDVDKMKPEEAYGILNRTDPEPEDITESVPTMVALDCETELFTEKYAESKTWVKFKKIGKTPVTPRTARMIGLALSYNGAERTSYTTDPEAWPLLMPEFDQTVIMHNAKFDLGVLRRAGLPTPERWECTQIAAHLLDEVGNHGLKPLAKKHLGIDDPTTFKEADRMRLLNPEIFEEYARNDARYTFRLWPKFQRELTRQGLMKLYQLEKDVVLVTSEMDYSEDTLLLSAYTNGASTDLHRLTASKMFGKSETEVTDSERSVA